MNVSTVSNKSLEQWAQAYWSWWVTLDPEPDFYIDPNTNGHRCIIRSTHDDNMVFLINSYSLQYASSCNVSSDKYILVPLLVGSCDPTVPGYKDKAGQIEELWACATNGN